MGTKNPVEEFLEMKKAASQLSLPGMGSGFGDTLRSGAQQLPGLMGNAMVSGAAGALTAAGVAGLGAAASHLLGAVTKRHDFRSMLEHNEDLQEHLEADPKRFNQAFTSLRNANPSYAKDPLIAGTYMRRMLENPLSMGGMLTEAMGGSQPGHPVQEAAGRAALSQLGVKKG